MTDNNRRPRRGKEAHPDYAALVARIPKRLRADFQKLLIDFETDTNTLVERLLRGLVDGVVTLEDLPPAADPDQASEGPVGEGEVDQVSAPARREDRVDASPPPNQASGGAATIDESALPTFEPLSVEGWEGEDFKQLRLQLGYKSGGAISQALGLHRTTFGQYERGGTPGEDVRRRLRALLQHHSVGVGEVGPDRSD